MPQQKVLHWGSPMNETMKVKLKLVVMNILSSSVKETIFKRKKQNFFSLQIIHKMKMLTGVI